MITSNTTLTAWLRKLVNPANKSALKRYGRPGYADNVIREAAELLVKLAEATEPDAWIHLIRGTRFDVFEAAQLRGEYPSGPPTKDERHKWRLTALEADIASADTMRLLKFILAHDGSFPPGLNSDSV